MPWRLALLLLLSGVTRFPLAAVETAPPSDADGALHRTILRALRLKNHSSWPNAHQDHQVGMSVGELRRTADELLEHWRAARALGTERWRAGLAPKAHCDIRASHRQLILWFLIRQPGLLRVIEKIKRRLAYGLGLVDHHQQWTVDFNPALLARPLHKCGSSSAGCPPGLDRTRWPVLDVALGVLERRLADMTEEFRRLLSLPGGPAYEESEGLHLTGSWRAIDILPLRELHAGPPMGNAAIRCPIMAEAPRSCAALKEFSIALQSRDSVHPWVQEARFHLMLPGTKVVQHTAITNQRLKVHCGLRNPAKVRLHIANNSVIWEEGRCMVVDDSYEHRVLVAKDQQARAILQIKISHPDLAWAPLLRMGKATSPSRHAEL